MGYGNITKNGKKDFDIRNFRQTCRLRLKINGEEKIVKLLFDHQEPQGLNNRPVGSMVHLVPDDNESLTNPALLQNNGGWYPASEIEVLDILPWEK